MYNPSLRQIPRRQTAEVLPTQQEPSILVWLESTGRLKPRDPVEVIPDEADSEELSDLMGDGDADDDYDMGVDDED
ncbi:MAG: DUF3134 domain-containing protein [Leptolyngbyaceae cyanobacterium T60_A2020_046]|nr:DUF3134 domain-containing protein [Leptolyngbyaceae cyanobacterium T60_A2020_046]